MVLSLALKGRHKNSPGREPWDSQAKGNESRRGERILETLSPILGLSFALSPILGLTPQAIGLTPF